MIIDISNLSFNAIIGLLDFERVTEQKVLVDCQIEYEYTSDFIDYSVVATIIEDEIKAEKFELIEEALLHLESKIHSKFPTISILQLKITKPDILNNCSVSVSNKAIFKGS